jgi:hypothetical protein
MDIHSFFADRHVCRASINPGPRVVVGNTIGLSLEGDVSVSAKYAIDVARSGVGERTVHHAGRHAGATRVQAIDEPGQTFPGSIDFLDDILVEEISETNQKRVALNKGIELVSMNGEMAFSKIFPHEPLVDGHANQVRHDIGQSEVMIAFDPYHLDFSFGIGKLADAGEELPVIAVQPPEIEVCEYVSQKDEPSEALGLNQIQRLARSTDLRSEVHVREQQRVDKRLRHAERVKFKRFSLMTTWLIS